MQFCELWDLLSKYDIYCPYWQCRLYQHSPSEIMQFFGCVVERCATSHSVSDAVCINNSNVVSNSRCQLTSGLASDVVLSGDAAASMHYIEDTADIPPLTPPLPNVLVFLHFLTKYHLLLSSVNLCNVACCYCKFSGFIVQLCPL